MVYLIPPTGPGKDFVRIYSVIWNCYRRKVQVKYFATISPESDEQEEACQWSKY